MIGLGGFRKQLREKVQTAMTLNDYLLMAKRKKAVTTELAVGDNI